MRVAAIDVGTVSVQLCVGELDSGSRLAVLEDSTLVSRLGEGSDIGSRLAPDAMHRTATAIGQQLETARRTKAETIRLVGTSALREVDNLQVFLDLVDAELGVTVEVLPEYEEGRLVYLGVMSDADMTDPERGRMVFDVGGASTEVTFGTGWEMDLAVSARLGTIMLTERYLSTDPPKLCELVTAGMVAEKHLARIRKRLDADTAVGVGGSVVNLARLCKGVPVDRTPEVHGMAMGFGDVRKVLYDLISVPRTERAELVGLEPGRADTILAGGVIIDRLIGMLEIPEFTVSTRGLRHGVLAELLVGVA